MICRIMIRDQLFSLQCIEELRSSMGEEAVEMFDHYNMLSKIHVDIANFGQYFITTIETLLISQRKVHVSVNNNMANIHLFYNCFFVGNFIE